MKQTEIWRGGGFGEEKTEKYRSDIHMYVGLGYNVFKLREKGLAWLCICIYIYIYGISIGDE